MNALPKNKNALCSVSLMENRDKAPHYNESLKYIL